MQFTPSSNGPVGLPCSQKSYGFALVRGWAGGEPSDQSPAWAQGCGQTARGCFVSESAPQGKARCGRTDFAATRGRFKWSIASCSSSSLASHAEQSEVCAKLDASQHVTPNAAISPRWASQGTTSRSIPSRSIPTAANNSPKSPRMQAATNLRAAQRRGPNQTSQHCRTTLIVRHIPAHYNREKLLEEVHGCSKCQHSGTPGFNH